MQPGRTRTGRTEIDHEREVDQQPDGVEEID
jgi:hypothetical protein